MTDTIGKPERATQNRVIKLFSEQLGYTYLGDWADQDNSNIEEQYLSDYLTEAGYSPAHISQAIHQLKTEAGNTLRDLYTKNEAVYQLLRYGVDVKVEGDTKFQKVWLIDWKKPRNNHFALAEEVTLRGNQERRPDIVLYVNGIAVGVLELKNSRVSVGDGIYQNLSNQTPEFNAWFFTTVQFVFAGNDSEGLRYGTIGTPGKFFLQWKEDEADNSAYKLDKYLLKLCEKSRLIELMHDFILFDGGIKKLPRPHQYFGIKAAQGRVRKKQGGIIWHTQGSGKSILMVLLARWILENNSKARVVLITDRDELDKQIKRVFESAGEKIYRTSSGCDLMAQLGQPAPRLLCSLVHKFGQHGKGKSDSEFDDFISELQTQPCQTVGELFVFVDECHRTQGGRLNRAMKALMPGAVFIGFTGTPLLKKDAATSLEVFGGYPYIHTYKFAEAVEDKVVLDLIYEARDIDQKLGSQDKVDAYFEAKTQPLNDWQKNELKKRWGTLQAVLSSRPRMDRIVTDIEMDFATKPRLSEFGNAMLVAGSIYEACKYYTLFQQSTFRGKCAVITSYNPQTKDVTLEETGADSETDRQFIYKTYVELLKDVPVRPNMTKTEAYEEDAKEKFIRQPAKMKLLIVVDKLLTGFDAPPCSCLYIDKSMQDHGLFQAICRTNRLDGDDKEFGYIVDYKDLFRRVENAMAVYSSELDHSAGGATPDVMLQTRVEKGKERLDAALETLALLMEKVEPPKEELQCIHYFCGNSEIASDLKEHEPRRVALYTGVVGLLRAYAAIGDELDEAGYDAARQAAIRREREDYVKLRASIRLAAGETLDLKPYEADMRNLIDRYIEADASRKISEFDNIGLVDLIVKSGIADAIAQKLGQMKERESVAETIENNIRSKIIKDQLTDPAYFAKMSALLDEIIKKRKEQAVSYEEYLKQIQVLVSQVQAGRTDDTPDTLDTPGKRALYNNLKSAIPDNTFMDSANASYGEPKDAALDFALALDTAIRNKRPDGWRGVQAKENVIKQALWEILQDNDAVERIFHIIFAQPEY
ncbi:MAG: type I restriction endonuclease subunit R [Candidatus Accumulibacter sp.]|jgi:type I restriction enzyme R subunit|nr:type I restriction endonuclease subunit R [Accumulibacter sp.]